jgi:hypothetical protein
MKIKMLIVTAIGVVLTAAVVLFSIGYYGDSKNKVNKGLYAACSSGNAAAASYWLAKGADVNAPDTGHQGIPGQTPLMMCAHLDSETVELLLLLGANPNAVDADGRPVIHFVTDGYIANKLVLYGADVNKTDKEGLTALQWRQKNNYIMDDELKTVLEGNGPASKLWRQKQLMREQNEKEGKQKK